MAGSEHERLESGFADWISQQSSDLDELLKVVNGPPDPDPDPEMLRRLADKSIQHLEDYHQTRSISGAGGDAFFMLSPAWCSSLENSLFWMGGLKPSVFIRLVYTISGSEFGSTDIKQQLSKWFEDGERNGYSGVQLNKLKELHLNIISREDKISSRMAILQEDIGAEAVVTMATGGGSSNSRGSIDGALTAHEAAVGGIVADADKLRLSVLKELIHHILTPLQAIHLLVASNRLHLSIHQWGKRRDHIT